MHTRTQRWSHVPPPPPPGDLEAPYSFCSEIGSSLARILRRNLSYEDPSEFRDKLCQILELEGNVVSSSNADDIIPPLPPMSWLRLLSPVASNITQKVLPSLFCISDIQSDDSTLREHKVVGKVNVTKYVLPQHGSTTGPLLTEFCFGGG